MIACRGNTDHFDRSMFAEECLKFAGNSMFADTGPAVDVDEPGEASEERMEYAETGRSSCHGIDYLVGI